MNQQVFSLLYQRVSVYTQNETEKGVLVELDLRANFPPGLNDELFLSRALNLPLEVGFVFLGREVSVAHNNEVSLRSANPSLFAMIRCSC